MVFVLQLQGSEQEPRWMDAEGRAPPYLSEAKRFRAIPASGHDAFFVIEPKLPNEIWARWHPYFFSNAEGSWLGPLRPRFCWRELCRRLCLRRFVGLGLALLLVSLPGCASQTSGPQTGGIRLPNCNIHVYGSRPVWGCQTGGMTIPVGR